MAARSAFLGRGRGAVGIFDRAAIGLRKGRRDNLINARQNFDEMSDGEVAKAVDTELQFRQSELDIIRKYDPQFRKVLPIKKVARLYQAEEAFKRKLLEMLQERREGRDGPPRGPGR